MLATPRLRALGSALAAYRDLWHAQPFRMPDLPWFESAPGLQSALLRLDSATIDGLNRDSQAALDFLAGHFPELEALQVLLDLPPLPKHRSVAQGSRWAWEIPGRKQAQIEAFASVAQASGRPVLDWCGGKGHLGRLLALRWQVPVETLEIDPVLCRQGAQLAARLSLDQRFAEVDALQTEVHPRPGQQGVALHACGELHRRLIVRACAGALPALDIAPCCYHRGISDFYSPLSPAAALKLTRDDTRLAVTETVTASPRLQRQRDREMAWKLAFDVLRRRLEGDAYRSFKSVPAAWFRVGFVDFLGLMAARERLPVRADALARWGDELEAAGWARQAEVMRFSVVRHAFRRALELWLVFDLAAYLEAQGYAVRVGEFCERRLTPRNLLIAARRSD